MEFYVGSIILSVLFAYGLFWYNNSKIIVKNREYFLPLAGRLESAILEFNTYTQGIYYFNYRKGAGWKYRFKDLKEAIERNPDRRGLSEALISSIQKFEDFYSNLDKHRANYNDSFVQNEKIRYAHLFNQIEKFPLDYQQQEVILRDEDNTLVIAGAGTGKTSTVIGKAVYVLEKKLSRPHELLLISFTKKSAEEMADRIRERVGVELKVKTFNAFGYEVIGKVEGARPAIAFEGGNDAVEAFLNRVLNSQSDNAKFLESLISFFAYNLVPEKLDSQFKSLNEYYQYINAYQLLTLQGELVKSFEELKIANFFYLNGIKYKYEEKFQPEQRDPNYKVYRPDFYLPDYGITLEHFGVDKNGEVPGFFRGKDGRSAKETYWAGIRWKRDLHKRYNKPLIETYSYEFKEGTIFKNLKKKLEQLNVKFRPIPPENVLKKVQEHQQAPAFIKLISTFLSLVKSNHTTLRDLRAKVSMNDSRSQLFLDVFEVFYNAYQSYLKDNDMIDFNDMLNKAGDYIRQNRYRSPFSYILIDEFQDMSVGRYKLVKSLLEQNPAQKLFCVGDDWQSIYRFSGSDISLTTQFEDYFGYTYRGKIETTYRFNKGILDYTSKFIQKNHFQLRKNLQSKKISIYGIPFQILTYEPQRNDDAGKTLAIRNALALIQDESIKREIPNPSVLLLGRYNHTKPSNMHEFERGFPSFKIEFLTAHSAKGLTYDFSVLIDVIAGKHGFPTEMIDDPILNLVLHEGDRYENSEERRLFYVALTRARHKNFLITQSTNTSKFIHEMETDLFSTSQVTAKTCQQCNGMMTKRSGTYGLFWSCSNYPYCENTERYDQREAMAFTDKVEGLGSVAKNSLIDDVDYPLDDLPF